MFKNNILIYGSNNLGKVSGIIHITTYPFNFMKRYLERYFFY